MLLSQLGFLVAFALHDRKQVHKDNSLLQLIFSSASVCVNRFIVLMMLWDSPME